MKCVGDAGAGFLMVSFHVVTRVFDLSAAGTVRNYVGGWTLAGFQLHSTQVSISSRDVEPPRTDFLPCLTLNSSMPSRMPPS